MQVLFVALKYTRHNIMDWWGMSEPTFGQKKLSAMLILWDVND